jgi:hypothetical protein
MPKVYALTSIQCNRVRYQAGDELEVAENEVEALVKAGVVSKTKPKAEKE